MMQNSIILPLNLLLIAFSTKAYSHTGAHSDDWLQTTIHFVASLDHLPFIVPATIILGLAIRRNRKYFIWETSDSGIPN